MRKGILWSIMLCGLAGIFVLISCGGNGSGGDGSKTFVFVANDNALQIAVYQLNRANGDLTPIGRIDVPDGRPHTLMVNPTGTRLYSSLLGAAQVAGFTINQDDGTLSAIPGSPWASSNYPADGAFSPSGNYFYVPNYNSNNIVGYSVNQDSGALAALPGSPYASSSGPYGSACISNGYLYVAVSGIDSISAFLMDPSTGSLTPSPLASTITAGEPYALVTDPSDEYLYVANYGASNIGAYAISSSTGALTEVNTSPYATSGYPWTLAMDPLGRYLYVSSETTQGYLQGFNINPDGTLSPMSGPALAFSDVLDDLSVDPSGTFLFSSNVYQNKVWVHRIDPADGTLSAGVNTPFAMSNPYNVVAVEVK